MTATLSSSAVSPAKLVDVEHAAEMLGCSSRHVYRLADAGKMPAPVRLGSLVRWNRSTLEDWIAAGCPPVRTVTAKGGAR